MNSNLQIKKDCTRPKEQSNNNLQSGHSTHTNPNPSFSNSQPKLDALELFMEATEGDAYAAYALLKLHRFGKRTNIGKKDEKGRNWFFNTVEQWKLSCFPKWSTFKIGRILRNLESLGFIQSSTKFNSQKTDQCKWYTINYDKISPFISAQNKTVCKNANSNLHNSITIENETVCKNATDFVEPKTMNFATNENDEQKQDDSHFAKSHNIITNTKPDLSIPPNLPIPPTTNVSGIGEVGDFEKFPPVEKTQEPDTVSLGDQKPQLAQPIQSQGDTFLNRAEDKKLREDAIEILCAVNEARAKLQKYRPDSDKTDKSDPLTYDYTDENLADIIKLLSEHPQGTKENCLAVVKYRASQIPKENNWFYMLSATKTWWPKYFEGTLDHISKNQPKLTPKKSAPKPPKKHVEVVAVEPEVKLTEEEANQQLAEALNSTGVQKNPAMREVLERILKKEPAPVVKSKPVVTQKYNENFEEYLRNPKKSDRERLIEVEAMARQLQQDRLKRERLEAESQQVVEEVG